MTAIPRYESVVRKIASSVPFGIALKGKEHNQNEKIRFNILKKKNLITFCGSLKSPLIFAPANMPVAAGKKIENTEKKSCVLSVDLSCR
jgi:hypothetical protein